MDIRIHSVLSGDNHNVILVLAKGHGIVYYPRQFTRGGGHTGRGMSCRDAVGGVHDVAALAQLAPPPVGENGVVCVPSLREQKHGRLKVIHCEHSVLRNSEFDFKGKVRYSRSNGYALA